VTAQSFDSFQLPAQKTAFVFGNEGFGVTEIAKKTANTLIYLPMHGFVDSLNLSVTVGIVTHWLSMARRSQKSSLFSESEKEALSKKWIDRDIKKRNRL